MSFNPPPQHDYIKNMALLGVWLAQSVEYGTLDRVVSSGPTLGTLKKKSGTLFSDDDFASEV